MGGCKCDLCKKANSTYENQRAIARKQGLHNGIVSASEARKHLLWLSKKAVGYKAVCDVTNLPQSTVWAIYSGERKNCRAETARKILKVTPAMAADGAYVDAKHARSLIKKLLNEGYTKVQIAVAIGQKRALQLGMQKITVAHAAKIEAVFKRLHGQLTDEARQSTQRHKIKTETQNGFLTRNLKTGHVIHVMR